MLRNMLIRLFINATALWIVDLLFPGIWFETTTALVGAAIVFGILNTFLKPILILFTLPINILTLGLFTIVINALILMLTAGILQGYHLNGFFTAIFAAILISIVSIFLQSILKED